MSASMAPVSGATRVGGIEVASPWVAWLPKTANVERSKRTSRVASSPYSRVNRNRLTSIRLRATNR